MELISTFSLLISHPEVQQDANKAYSQSNASMHSTPSFHTHGDKRCYEPWTAEQRGRDCKEIEYTHKEIQLLG